MWLLDAVLVDVVLPSRWCPTLTRLNSTTNQPTKQVPCYREAANYPNHSTACSAREQAQVLAYADSYLDALAPVRAKPANGAFITSCICHECPWSSLTLGGRTSWEHYADWHAGHTTGAAAVHIDTRAPDGGGALPPMHPACFKWP